jgi:hypothetical protein
VSKLEKQLVQELAKEIENAIGNKNLEDVENENHSTETRC